MKQQRHSFKPPPDVILPTAEDLKEITMEADREAGARGPSQMIRGASIFAVGTAITLLTFLAAAGGGGIYIIAYGAIFGGLADFVLGFENWRRGKRAKAKSRSIDPK